jgi:transcriptional regulator with XRE-family HTH domain
MAAKRKGASSKKKASRKKSRAKKGRAKKGAARKSARKAASGKKTAAALGGGGEDGDRSLLTVLGDLAGDFAGDVTGEISRRMRQLQFEAGVMLPLRASKALLLAPENPLMAQKAGAYLREVRELAGLTVHDVGEAVEVADESILEAVENGTAAVSFELLLRLAAILARHDPVPVVLKFMRTYNPEVFSMLESWGVGRLPLQYEREREFVNIFRRHDAARELSDDGFERVLDFTRAAFEMSLHFVAAEEDVVDEEHEVEDE